MLCTTQALSNLVAIKFAADTHFQIDADGLFEVQYGSRGLKGHVRRLGVEGKGEGDGIEDT